jgi:hypothetical protein
MAIIKKIIPAISKLLQQMAIDSKTDQKTENELITAIIMLLIKLGGFL